MPVKLMRSDSEDGHKLSLINGTHLLGRGPVLQVYDKRVSRTHAEIKVNVDSITLKALHQNPCFYIKKDSNTSETLQINSTVELCNTDKFGLLPNLYWFEIIIIDGCENDSNVHKSESTTDNEASKIYDANVNNNETSIQSSESTTCSGHESEQVLTRLSSNTEPLSPKCSYDSQQTIPNQSDQDEPTNQANQEQDQNATKQNQSTNNQPTSNQAADTLSPTNRTNESDTMQNDEAKSSGKRSCSDNEVEVKKIKLEPGVGSSIDEVIKPSASSTEENPTQKIKVEPNNAAGSSEACADSTTNNPVPPPNTVRERCYYGAGCYRRNIIHLAHYSHPKDSDWGSGAKGECPYGAACVKSDPRHWNTHYHPPQTRRLPHVQNRKKKKRKRRDESSSDDSLPQDLILNKRKRRVTQTYAGFGGLSDSEPDPFDSDDTDDWLPDSSSQDY